MTRAEFYAKYGTGIVYADYFSLMCKSKGTAMAAEFISDLEAVLSCERDPFLQYDYVTITN